jgi:hypothetical protein
MTDCIHHHWTCSQASATPPAADIPHPNDLVAIDAAIYGTTPAQILPGKVDPAVQKLAGGNGARVNARARATQSWHAAGIEIGRRWAAEAADAAQLARVADIEEAELGKLHDTNGWLTALWCAMEGGNCPLPSAVPEMFVQLFGNEYIRVSQLRGFVDGVRDVRTLRRG